MNPDTIQKLDHKSSIAIIDEGGSSNKSQKEELKPLQNDDNLSQIAETKHNNTISSNKFKGFTKTVPLEIEDRIITVDVHVRSNKSVYLLIDRHKQNIKYKRCAYCNSPSPIIE